MTHRIFRTSTNHEQFLQFVRYEESPNPLYHEGVLFSGKRITVMDEFDNYLSLHELPSIGVSTFIGGVLHGPDYYLSKNSFLLRMCNCEGSEGFVIDVYDNTGNYDLFNFGRYYENCTNRCTPQTAMFSRISVCDEEQMNKYPGNDLLYQWNECYASYRDEYGVVYGKNDLHAYYLEQFHLQKKLIKVDVNTGGSRYLGVSGIMYNELEYTIVAMMVVIDTVTQEVVARVHKQSNMDFLYMNHLFSFFEYPLISALIAEYGLQVDLLMHHGLGINHPRSMGTACHLGIELDMPTFAFYERKLIGCLLPNPTRGFDSVWMREKEEVARFVTCNNGTQERGYYVSPGHKTSMERAYEFVTNLPIGEDGNPYPITELFKYERSLKYVKSDIFELEKLAKEYQLF